MDQGFVGSGRGRAGKESWDSVGGGSVAHVSVEVEPSGGFSWSDDRRVPGRVYGVYPGGQLVGWGGRGAVGSDGAELGTDGGVLVG